MIQIRYNYRNRLYTRVQLKTMQTENGISLVALYPQYTIAELLGMSQYLADVADKLGLGECHLVLYAGSERRYSLISGKQ